jgi:hypothetical protein
VDLRASWECTWRFERARDLANLEPPVRCATYKLPSQTITTLSILPGIAFGPALCASASIELAANRVCCPRPRYVRPLRRVSVVVCRRALFPTTTATRRPRSTPRGINSPPSSIPDPPPPPSPPAAPCSLAPTAAAASPHPFAIPLQQPIHANQVLRLLAHAHVEESYGCPC